MDLASVVAALASVGVRVSGSTPNSSVQVDSSRACPTGLAGPEPSGTINDPGQHFQGDTLLKYERTVATALLCHTAWHTAMPGQAFAEEFCESLLSSLVTKTGQNRGAVTIEDVDDLYQLITIRKEGHRVNVCKIPNSFVDSVRQRLTAYLNAEGVYVPWVRWCAEPTCTIQAHWPRRGVPNFPLSLLIQKGSNHYKQVLVSVLLVLTQQGRLKAGFRRKLSELIPQRSVLEEQREADTL